MPISTDAGGVGGGGGGRSGGGGYMPTRGHHGEMGGEEQGVAVL
jgi:hypothetical protein